jgi:DNA-binding GntR family transcriptional regulator
MEAALMDGELKKIKVETYSNIRDNTLKELREAILDGKLKPGERLIERDIAGKLGISRTPVREAIRKLELEGLVTQVLGKGVVVAKISFEEVIEIYNIRAVLEGLAAKLAAEKINLQIRNKLKMLISEMETAIRNDDQDKMSRLNTEFHEVIYKSARSPRLYQMLSNMSEYVEKFAKTGYKWPGRISEATKEHEQIAEAIIDRNGSLAQQFAIAHIDRSKDIYIETAKNKGQK